MNVFTIAKKEIITLSRLRSVIITLFVLPLLLIFILGSALASEFSASDAPNDPIRLAVFSQDTGQLTKQFQIFAKETGTMLSIIKAASRERVIEKLRKGQADFGLVIPRSFSANAMRGVNDEWEAVLGKNHRTNIIAQNLLQSFLDEFNRSHAEAIVTGSDNRQVSTPASGSARNQNYVEMENLEQSNMIYSAKQYYSANMLVMFLFYGGMAAAISIVQERENNTLNRLNSLPLKASEIITGKMLGNGIFTLIQAILIIAVTKWAFGVDWGGSVIALSIIVLCTVVSSLSIAMITALLFKTTKSVNLVLPIIIITMTFVSGGFSPGVGNFILSLGKFTVFHWASNSFMRLMLNNSASLLMQNIMILGYISTGLFLVAVTVYRKVGYHE